MGSFFLLEVAASGFYAPVLQALGRSSAVMRTTSTRAGWLLLGLALIAANGSQAAEVKAHALLTSPNGRIEVAMGIDAAGQPRYEVSLDRKPVLLPSRLGLVRDDADFSRNLQLVK